LKTSLVSGVAVIRPLEPHKGASSGGKRAELSGSFSATA